MTFAYVYESTNSEQPVNVGIYKVKDATTLGSTDLIVRRLYTIKETTSSRYISNITASSGPKAEFTYDDNAKSLINITIRDLRKGSGSSANFVKGFNFAYQSVSYVYAYSRQFLKSISEYSGCDRMPPYTFSYLGLGIGDNTSLQYPGNNIDFWGYYNGANNSNLIPKIYIYPAASLADRYRFSQIPSYQGQEVILDGADRRPNNGAKQLGTLNTIIYPQGGSTYLVYESDRYFDATTNQSLLGGGLRISSMNYTDGMNPSTVIIKNFEYKDASNNSSGRLISKPVFAMPSYKWKDPGYPNSTSTSNDKTYSSLTGDDIWKFLTVRTEIDISSSETTHGNPIGYKVVTVKRPGSGSAKFEYYIPGVYGETSNGGWTATTNKFARANISPTPNMGVVNSGGAWMFPNSPNPTFDYERGLLWKKSESNAQNKLVRSTENTYQYLYGSGTQATSVSGLKYDTYSLCDDIWTANKIFFYGKYSLLTNVDKVLKKQTVITYDANDATSTKYITESTEYIYGSSNHKLLTQLKRTGGDGTIYTNRIKYPKDYSHNTSNAEQAVLMIANLQDNFRHGIPIEQISTVKTGSDSTRVISGSFVKFDPFGLAKPLVESQWSLSTKASIRIDSFKNSSIVLQSSYKFDFDSHYEKVMKYNDYPTAFQPSSGIGIDRQTFGAGYGYNNSLPVFQIKNALLSQAAFSDFEAATGTEFTSSTPYYGAGRTGTNSFYPGVMLTKASISKASVNNYILSFWIKSNASLTFSVSLKNSPGNSTATYYTDSFSVASTGGSDYKYVQQIIPVTGVSPSSFNIELQGQSLTTPPSGGSSSSLIPVIDDVAFFPENADLVSYTYQIPYGPASVANANGTATHTVYDNIGRVRYLLNQDKNIVKRNTYKFTDDNGPSLVADFPVPDIIYATEATAFTATDNPCLTDVTYTWNFGSGNVTGQSQTPTFATSGTQSVTLTVTKSQYTTKSVTKIVTVINRPIAITTCAKGVQEFSSSNNQTVSNYSCSSISDTPPAYGVIFKVTSVESGCSGGCTYRWQIRDVGTTSWIDIGTNSDQYTYQKVLATSHSFEVICSVTHGVRTGSSPPIPVMVTP